MPKIEQWAVVPARTATDTDKTAGGENTAGQDSRNYGPTPQPDESRPW